MTTHPDFISGAITTDYLDSREVSPILLSPNPDPATLVAIAAAASRFGLDRVGSGSSESFVDEHTGHSGDPFRP